MSGFWKKLAFALKKSFKSIILEGCVANENQTEGKFGMSEAHTKYHYKLKMASIYTYMYTSMSISLLTHTHTHTHTIYI